MRLRFSLFARLASAFSTVDSLPWLAFGIYRPLWILFFVPFLVKSIADGVALKSTGYLALVILYGVCVGVLAGTISAESLLICVLFFIAFTGLSLVFRELIIRSAATSVALEPISVMSAGVRRYILLGMFLPALVGCVYILSEEMARYVTGLFSFRVYSGRAQYLSGEPSWAAKYLLVFIACSFYVKAKRLRALLVSAALVFLLLTESTLGFILLFVWMLWVSLSTNLKRTPLILLAVVILLAVLQAVEFGEYTENRLRTLLRFTEEGFAYLSETNDRSFLIRLISPMTGVIIFLQSAGLGVGIDGSQEFYESAISILFSIFDIELSLSYFLVGGVSSKNIYTKIIAEFGVIGVLCIVWLLYVTFFRMPKGFFKNLCVMIALIMLNSDGYLFFPFVIWVALAAHVKAIRGLNMAGKKRGRVNAE